MKKNLRYGLIAVLILALLVVTAIAVSAAGEVQLLDSELSLKQAYDTLPEAAAAAEDGDTINITADLADVAAVRIEVEDATIAINGNNHTVTFAAGAGLTIGAATSADITNVTFATADTTAIGLTMDEDSYDLTLNGVTITGFGTGLYVNSISNVDIQGSTITALAVGINLRPTSEGGLLTLATTNISLTRTDVAQDGDAAIICNGADIIISSGNYAAPLEYHSGGAGLSAALRWSDGSVGSHVTVNGGNFTRESACVIFALWGDGSTIPNFGGVPFLVFNGGNVDGGTQNNPVFYDQAKPVKGDNNAETFADIVINGGTFRASTTKTGDGNEPIFYLRGVMRLTVNDGTFIGRRGMMLINGSNARREDGHLLDPVESNFYGGTYEFNSFVQIPSSAAITSVINFGKPGTKGPEVTLYKHRMNKQTFRAAIFLSNGGAAHGLINFYSGTFTMLNESGRSWDNTPDAAYSTPNFIHGAGATVAFYGGNFNYYMNGNFIQLADADQYSVIKVLSNPGESGIVVDFGETGGNFINVSSGNYDCNNYNVTDSRLINDPVEGDKLLINITAGTFRGGTRWLVHGGSGINFNIGAPETDGPTFEMTQPYYGGFIHMSNSCSTLHSGSNADSIPKVSKTPGTINVYSGTFTTVGEVDGMFNCHGGRVHIYGGTFSCEDGRMFNFRDQDTIGELIIDGGTFNLTGDGTLIGYNANYAVGNSHKGAITLNAGTFQAVDGATGSLITLTTGNMIDNPETNDGTSDVTIAPAFVLDKGTNGRYFNVGVNFRTNLILGDRVFPEDPSDGLGGYKAVAVAGGYKVQLTPANKVFAGAQMSLTDEYQMHMFWKLTEAQVAAYTKTSITGIGVFAGEHAGETVNIGDKIVRDTYPDGSAVESGYKVVEVVLPKMPIQLIGASYYVELYVDDAQLVSLTCSALDYLRGLSYQLDDVKKAKQAAAIEANPETTADELAALVVGELNTQKVAATLVQFAYNVSYYARKDVVADHNEPTYGYTIHGIPWFNDKGFVAAYRVGFSAIEEENKKAAAWTYEANTNANLTGVGARFDTTMQLYVKFTAASLDGISVTYKVGDGAAQEAKIVDKGDGNYVAYTQFTNLDNLTKDVTFTLSGDTNTQTCTYSFTAFISSYQTIDDGENGEYVHAKALAKALKQFSDAVALIAA